MQSQTALLVVNPADRRRSQRLLQFVPLVVRGASAGNKTFWEDTFTVNISVHGALVILAAKVGVGQKLVLMNPENWQEEDVRVARLGTFDGTRTQVGIEFMQAAPRLLAGWRHNESPGPSHAISVTARSACLSFTLMIIECILLSASLCRATHDKPVLALALTQSAALVADGITTRQRVQSRLHRIRPSHQNHFSAAGPPGRAWRPWERCNACSKHGSPSACARPRINGFADCGGCRRAWGSAEIFGAWKPIAQLFASAAVITPLAQLRQQLVSSAADLSRRSVTPARRHQYSQAR